MKNYLILGYGKTGSHLHYAIRNSLGKLNVTIIKNSGSAISKSAVLKAGIIFICTQDGSIINAVNKIIKTGADLKGKIIAHTSGALSSDELLRLKQRGALTASFHPVQTFMRKARRDGRLFDNIYIAIEGNPIAKKELFKLAKKIKSNPLEIKKENKILHHLCCVISSNYLLTNLSFLSDIYTLKNGFKKVNFFNIYMPLIEQTLRNICANGIEKSLTGPIARNDLKTVKLHISAVKKLKLNELNDYYKFIGQKTGRLALRKGSISKKNLLELNKILGVKN